MRLISFGRDNASPLKLHFQGAPENPNSFTLGNSANSHEYRSAVSFLCCISKSRLLMRLIPTSAAVAVDR